MNRQRRQAGMTLVVALVMLVVLTLIVASAIRFGNINLKITGNVQSETEAVSAAQVALESMIQAINGSTNISAISSQTSSVSTGGTAYAVTVAKPGCLFNKPVNNADLDPAKSGDRVCFDTADPERLLTANNTLTTSPTGCKDQQWDVTAAVDDNRSGSKATLLQGVSVRVGAEVQCP